METLCDKTENLTYLSSNNAIALSDNIGLVGHDGWGVARYGSWETTSARLFCFYREVATPFFACKAVGEAIFQITMAYPHRNIICLCGHTHYFAEAQILPNLKVIAASSDYHSPQIELLPEFKSL